MPNPSSVSSLPELDSENNKNINNCSNNVSNGKTDRNDDEKKAKAGNDSVKTLHRFEDVASELSRYIPTSEFSAGECGEPMFTQNLRIDFTPVAGVDDETVLEKKCSDFWAFIRQQPHIRNLEVLPMKEDAVAESMSCVTEESSDIPTAIPPAVHWLQQEVGQPAAFVGKPQKKDCDLNSIEETNTIQQERVKKHRYPGNDKMATETGRVQMTSCLHSQAHLGQKEINYLSKEAIRQKKIPSHPGAVDLCEQLEEWDRRHPRSMDPPGPVPTLLHAVMERNRD